MPFTKRQQALLLQAFVDDAQSSGQTDQTRLITKLFELMLKPATQRDRELQRIVVAKREAQQAAHDDIDSNAATAKGQIVTLLAELDVILAELP